MPSAPAIALAGGAAARMIDQDLAHQARRHAHEVQAVLPVDAVEPAQAHVGLVHQRGGLQGVVAAFVGQLATGDRAQLRIDQGDQPIARRKVAPPPRRQQSGELLGHRPESSNGSAWLASAGGARGTRRQCR